MILGLQRVEGEDDSADEFEVGKVDPRKKARRKEKRGQDKAESKHPKKPIGWAYVGSHNFTPSAWGTLSGSGFTPVLNVCISYLYLRR